MVFILLNRKEIRFLVNDSSPHGFKRIPSPQMLCAIREKSDFFFVQYHLDSNDIHFQFESELSQIKELK